MTPKATHAAAVHLAVLAGLCLVVCGVLLLPFVLPGAVVHPASLTPEVVRAYERMRILVALLLAVLGVISMIAAAISARIARNLDWGHDGPR